MSESESAIARREAAIVAAWPEDKKDRVAADVLRLVRALRRRQLDDKYARLRQEQARHTFVSRSLDSAKP